MTRCRPAIILAEIRKIGSIAARARVDDASHRLGCFLRATRHLLSIKTSGSFAGGCSRRRTDLVFAQAGA